MEINNPDGNQDKIKIHDIILESAVSTICDHEDSVAAVDAEDKVIGYKNWLGLMKGDLKTEFQKKGKKLLRKLNSDRNYISPKGKKFDQIYAKKILKKNTNIICGHFEGIDQRILETRNIEEISIGDFVLSGGEIGAFVIIDTVVRLLPGVLGNPHSLSEETFEKNLLEYPQYTKPKKWEEKEIPSVLLTGDHEKIKDWRLAQSEDITRRRRPDLWEKYNKNK